MPSQASSQMGLNLVNKLIELKSGVRQFLPLSPKLGRNVLHYKSTFLSITSFFFNSKDGIKFAQV